jgi:hypothetical protein
MTAVRNAVAVLDATWRKNDDVAIQYPDGGVYKV